MAVWQASLKNSRFANSVQRRPKAPADIPESPSFDSQSPPASQGCSCLQMFPKGLPAALPKGNVSQVASSDEGVLTWLPYCGFPWLRRRCRTCSQFLLLTFACFCVPFLPFDPSSSSLLSVRPAPSSFASRCFPLLFIACPQHEANMFLTLVWRKAFPKRFGKNACENFFRRLRRNA